MKRPSLAMAVGFVAMAAQIIFIRELLVVFSGDELAIGCVLCAWMVSGALGALALSAFSARIPDAALERAMPLSLAAAGLYLPCGIVLAQFCRSWFGLQPGEIFPLVPLMLTSALLVLPLCACLGFIFASVCRLHFKEGGTAAVYLFESLGAVCGGFITAFFLAGSFSSLQASVLIASFVFIVCSFYAVAQERPGTSAVFAFCAVFCIFLQAGGLLHRAERSLLERRWPGYTVQFSGESAYGSVAFLQRGSQLAIFENGALVASVPDRQRAEEAVHLCLLQHAAPRTILLIGGSKTGLLEELLAYGSVQVDHVELDPLLAMKSPDARVRTFRADGRFFVDRAGRTYDCVIIAASDLSTALGNRYFTRGFFRRLRNVMNDDAVVSFGLPASESFLTRQHRMFLSSVYRALMDVFPRTLAIPGETAWFFAGPRGCSLTSDYRVLMERARERRLDLAYVREYYLSSRMSPERMEWLAGELKKDRDIRANTDFQPSAYYYLMLSSFARSRDAFLSGAFEACRGHPEVLIAGLSVCVLAPGIPGLFSGSAALLASVSAMGFAAMSAQMVIVFLFQMLYGYLYHQLGLLFTFFMAGIALGTLRAPGGQGRERGRLLVLLACAAVFYALLPAVFVWLAQGGLVSRRLGALVFTGLSFVTGIFAGMQFGLSARTGVFIEKQESGGMLYAADLFGACLGALLTGVFLVPVLGVVPVCLIVSGLNIACLVLLRFML